jgi:hypothetical protein
MTPPFSAVDNVQAAGRVHRLTTKSGSDIKYLFTDTEVDNWNRKLITGKMAALNATVQGETASIGVDEFERPVTKTGTAPRPPKAAPKAPAGFISNKYGGYTPSGKYVEAGAGFVKNINGKWVVYEKGEVIKEDSLDFLTPWLQRRDRSPLTLKQRQERKRSKIFKEWDRGELNIGRSDKKVPKSNHKQAIAIALSESSKVGRK